MANPNKPRSSRSCGPRFTPEQVVLAAALLLIAQGCATAVQETLKEDDFKPDPCKTGEPTPDCFPRHSKQFCNQSGCYTLEGGVVTPDLPDQKSEVLGSFISGQDFYTEDLEPTLESGEKILRLAEFKEKNGGTNRDYLIYLAGLSDSHQETATVLEKMVEWKSDPDGRLHPAEHIVEFGGDCDNIANLFKEIYLIKGKKEGHDYKPRVIGMDIHAICLIETQDGRLVAIDSYMVTDIGTPGNADIEKGSSVFSGDLEEGEILFERVLLQDRVDISMDFSIDPKSLEKDHKDLNVQIYDKTDIDPFNPDELLPEDWKDYQSVLITIGPKRDAEHIQHFYNSGILFQSTFHSGDQHVVHYWPETGIINQINYKEGNPKFDNDSIIYEYFREDGTLSQIEYDPEGSDIYRESFNPDGTINDRVYFEGRSDIYCEFFDPSGRYVVQRKYNNGTTEFLNQDGQVEQVENFESQELDQEDKEEITITKWPETGNTRQILYKPGHPKHDTEKIDYENYREDGTLNQRIYLEGHEIVVEHFDEEGLYVTQRNLSNGEIISLRSDGSISQMNFPDGTIETFREDGTINQRLEIINGKEYLFQYDLQGIKVTVCGMPDGTQKQGDNCRP